MANGFNRPLLPRHRSRPAGGIGHGCEKRVKGLRRDGGPELSPFTVFLCFQQNLHLRHDAVEVGNVFIPDHALSPPVPSFTPP